MTSLSSRTILLVWPVPECYWGTSWQWRRCPSRWFLQSPGSLSWLQRTPVRKCMWWEIPRWWPLWGTPQVSRWWGRCRGRRSRGRSLRWSSSNPVKAAGSPEKLSEDRVFEYLGWKFHRLRSLFNCVLHSFNRDIQSIVIMTLIMWTWPRSPALTRSRTLKKLGSNLKRRGGRDGWGL